MRILASLVVVLFAFLSATVAFAEETPAAPQLTPEHRELAKWVGSWKGSAETKPNPFGPGGTMTWTEDCSWFGGAEFNVVCKSKGNGPTGPMEGLGIVGYNAGKKVYTHYGANNNGWSGYSEGTRSGDRWTFQSSEMVEGKTVHSRFTLDMASPKEMKFTWEMSEDGKTWTELMAGTSRKQ